MSLFLRDYRLIVGTPAASRVIHMDFVGGPPLGPGGNGIEIRDLEIKFDITRSTSGSQNKAKFEIFNLSPSSRALFETADDATNNPAIIFQVRYLFEPKVAPGDGFQTLFTGRVTNALTTKQGPDLVTQVQAGDGYVPLRDGRTARNFPKGTTRRLVLQKLLQDLNVPVGEIRDGGSLDQRFENGTTWEGPIRLALDQLLGPVNVEWSIQDDTFVAIRSDLSSLESVIDLTPQTGLINSPHAKKAKENRIAGTKQQSDHGVILETLLAPSIKPNVRVRVQSLAFPKGQIFKASKVTHKGDFRGTDWVTKVECVAVNDPIPDESAPAADTGETDGE